MWAVFRFMMYWYVLWSGVRAMLSVWRLPEGWSGPNFWVAPAGPGARHSIANVVAAAARRRIDIPPSLAWPRAALRRLSSPQSRGLQCFLGRAAGEAPPLASTLRLLQQFLRAR